MTSGDLGQLPPPPAHPQFVQQTGAAGVGWWWRATWPFGHLEATPDYVEISMLLGPTERLKRRDLGAVEVQRGALGSRIWLAPSSGRSSIWYSPMGSIDYLVWQLSMLGWPIRERAR